MKKIILYTLIFIIIVIMMICLSGCSIDNTTTINNESEGIEMVEEKMVDTQILNCLKPISVTYMEEIINISSNIGLKDILAYEFDGSFINQDNNYVLRYKLTNYEDTSISFIFDVSNDIVSFSLLDNSCNQFLEYYPYISTAILSTIDKEIFNKENSADLTLELINPENIKNVEGDWLESKIEYNGYDISFLKIPKIIYDFTVTKCD